MTNAPLFLTQLDDVPECAEKAAPFEIATVDCESFVGELAELRREIDEDLGERDFAHLRKMERWGRACTAIGALTAGIAPNPVSAICLALGRNVRWVIMHHVGHRGYDHVPGIPARYTSKVFARGGRRFVDFADWLTPASWVYEHNVLHHSHTAEMRDPDLIERNTEILRALPLPTPFRYGALAFLALLWRPGFYAPMALRAWKERGKNKEDDAGQYDARNIARSFFDLQLWRDCYFPYATLQFVLFPLLFAVFGPWAAFSAWCNSVLAEVLTNIHAFAVVLPNHCGDDLYRYDERPFSRGEACVRQVISSANYETGSDLLGFSHLWLNYQIEHHIWPDLPMLRYREVQPKVKALCAKYDVPYVQESLFARLKKMSDVVVGKSAMRRVARVDRPLALSALVVVGLACLSAPLAQAGALSPRDIMDRSEASQRLRDVTATATITTGDASGDTRVKVFTMWRRGEADGVHFSTLTRFSVPAEIRGEAILFEEHAGDENDVQLYLPRYKKVRRVESQSQSASFMGSALSYSDIATPHVDDYTHKLLRAEACPGDAAASCFVVELTPKTSEIAENTGYGRSVQWIRGDSFASVQTELYDRTGRLWKRILASDIREVDPSAHKLFTHSLRVDDLLAKRFTTLKFEQVKANAGLSDALFTAQSLAREM